MKPFITLAESKTPDGSDLSLHGHDGQFYLRVNRQPLMGTNASESEKTMATLACEPLRNEPQARVLIGGLGFGFTLRRVLESVRPDAHVHVAELLPQVVDWNREFLRDVNGALLDDPRVQVFVDDVYEVMTRAAAAPYDAILLDVDNGPIAMVHEGNGRLYQSQGFAVIMNALKPNGRVVFWSAAKDAAFARRLEKTGFAVQVVAAKAYPQAKRSTHTLFVADRKS